MKIQYTARIATAVFAIFCLFTLNACNQHEMWPENTIEDFPDKIGLKTDYSINRLGGYDLHDTKLTLGFSGDRFYRLSPAIADNKVYTLSDKGDITQLNATTGKIIWHAHHTHTIYSASPSASKTHLLLGTESGKLQSVSPDDGRILWEKELDATIIAPPSLTANQAIVRTQNDTVYAVSLKNGHVLWQHHEDTGEIVIHANSPPTIVGQYVLVGLSQGQLVILDLNDGRMLARHVLFNAHSNSIMGRMPDIVAQPLIDGYTAFVGSAHGGLVAYDLHTGKSIWRKTTDTLQNMALDKKQLYVSTPDAHLIAFDRKTGTIVWDQSALKDRQISAPALMGNTVVVADRYGHAIWLSKKDGSLLAFKNIAGSSIPSAPVAQNKSVYFYSLWGTLIKISFTSLSENS